MHWIILALMVPAFYAVANILDNFLSDKQFKNPVSLIVYSSLFNLIFIPLALSDNGTWPQISTIPIILILGFINIGYLYPYYRGLQSDDTSIAISFFALSRILIPIWAFFLIDERLELKHYFGMILIIVSTAALSLKWDKSQFRFSKAFWYIGLAAFLISFEAVLFKYLYDRGVSVGTAVGGEMTVSLILSMSLLLLPSVRKIIIADWRIFKKNVGLFALEEGFTFLAVVTEGFAISKAPVSLVKSLTFLTPFFLVLYAKLLGGFFPKWFKEQVTGGTILKKIVAFGLIVIGAILVGSS
jgi:drug/metabolite transporter (DMT)-like permease